MKVLKITILFIFITTLCSIFLTSSSVIAENTSVVDVVNLSVPVSCTISGTGMNSHNAIMLNGSYNSAIGETTLKAFCNDSAGFAIYAIGFTDDEYGKNVLTSSALGSSYDISTGTGLSGNSQWAMKLATNPSATYAVELQNNFDAFHTVPDAYTMVAKRTAGTDFGPTATGATLTTTYQAYISTSQPAGTYLGQVKYTLVHPGSAPAPIPTLTKTIEITYNSGILFFDENQTQTQNVVTYEASCGVLPASSGNTQVLNCTNYSIKNGEYLIPFGRLLPNGEAAMFDGWHLPEWEPFPNPDYPYGVYDEANLQDALNPITTSSSGIIQIEVEAGYST